ncbi:MAG: FG-GAP-like repeat-containing protein [Flavobacteriales bacterium]
MKNLFFFILITPIFLSGQAFIKVTPSNIIPIENGGVDWGDYDNDGDLDLFLIGRTGGTSTLSAIYTNNNGGFSNMVTTNIANYADAEISWGDFDNDGDLDFVVLGSVSSCAYSPLVRNDEIGKTPTSIRNFVDVLGGLQEMNQGSLDWGDYDNDGDLDLIATGYLGSTKFSNIYQNNNDSFVNINAGIIPFAQGVVKWVDYDNDQDLDVFITGLEAAGIIKSLIYENNNGIFTDINAGLVGVRFSDADWGDYDNDGDLDLVLVGDTNYKFPFSIIYQNNNGVFNGFSSNLMNVRNSSVKWADYDNDGDLDVILGGDTSYTSSSSYNHTEIYRNDGSNTFIPINANLPGYDRSNIKWADYDNDGDLDFVLTGYKSISPYRAGDIYSNQLDSTLKNNIPLSPSGLNSTVNNDRVNFSWNKSTDIETPQNGLYYNLYVGTMPGGVQTMSPMADISSGYRKKAQVGNTGSSNSWYLQDLNPGQYFWSVQAIDQAFAGSVFASEETFIVYDSLAPTLHFPYAQQKNVAVDTTLNWFSYAGAISYQLEVDTSQNFTSPIIVNTAITDTLLSFNLNSNTTYFWRVKANNLSDTSQWSSIRYFTTKPYFSEVETSVIGMSSGEASFGDYDNDGDLDIILTGATSYIKLYDNVNTAYIDNNVINISAAGGDVEWADYDNDGDLDFLLVSQTSGFNFTKVFANQGASFIDATGNINTSGGNKIAWGDYDNDGDLDFAKLGDAVYQNNNGVFTKKSPSFAITTSGDLAWGDYDNDGDLDLIMTGSQGGSGFSTHLYNNNGGVFTEVTHTLQTMTHFARARWGDFDQDGDLDLLLVGQTYNTPYTWAIYRNDNSIFNLHQAIPDGISYGDGKWGDLDNDGDLDVVVTGSSKSFIYINDNGVFNRLNVSLVGLNYSSVDLGDYDNDEDLDIIFTGNVVHKGNNYPTSKLYRNNIKQANTKPNAPINLLAQMNADSINFTWDTATDNETSSSGLYYNIYLGTAPGLIDSIAPMANLGNGVRQIVAIGNANSNKNWKTKNLTPGVYYWSVQAIDNNFSASSFAPEQIVSVITDIDDNNQTISTEVYPNPNNGSYMLYYTGSSNKLEIELINSNGQVINKQLFNNISGGISINYNDNEIASGIYFLKIISDKGLSTQKLIIK